jgi:hypothetical protein
MQQELKTPPCAGFFLPINAERPEVFIDKRFESTATVSAGGRRSAS